MNELEKIIAERREQLAGLLALTSQQEAAVAHAHMNELMRVLEEKQKLTAPLVALSQKLKRTFDSLAFPPEVSAPYRLQHEECNAMHRELIARENACEKSLAAVRGEISERAVHGDEARRAATGYSRSRTELPRGNQLDLSSDE